MNDMRLIDADEMAVNESEAYMKVNAREDVSPITQGINSVVHRKIQELIANTPTIDAVPVVRCRDCKHWHESTGYCNKHSYFIGADGVSCSPAESPSWTTWDADDFCSDGERKDGEG